MVIPILLAAVLFWFNPIQSSKNFFIRHDTPFVRALEEEIRQPEGYCAVGGMAGATLNGLGYASVSHVTAVPALDFWRLKYPNMKEDDVLGIFNRYSHISLIPESTPRVLNADNVGVPLRDFWPDRVEVPADIAGEAAPLWLQEGDSASGDIMPDRAGRIIAVDVLIGTGNESSDGVLVLGLCDAKACAGASRDLAGPLDNAYLHFKLDQPSAIDRPGRVQYEFKLRGGTHPVAWSTYPEPPSKSVKLMVEGQLMPSVPRFRIRYLPENN